MSQKVLISDSLSPRGIEILRAAGLEVAAKEKVSPEELLQIIGEYDGLIVRSATKVTAPVLAAAKRLRIVGRAGSGLDNVDLPEATKRGVVVMNTPGGNTVTTAEHTLGMLFAVARMIPQATASIREGRWEKKKFMGVELFGKTLGIIGLGNIGVIVANRAQGLKMQVIAFDPYISPEKAREYGVEMVDLPELYRRSDFITVHVPLTKETKDLLNQAAFARMKPEVRIVNCARGGIVNEQDLYEALRAGQVAGAAFDVFEKEPPGEHPLLGLEHFIATPHLGAATEEAQENVAVAVAEQVVDFLVHGTIRNAVNVPCVAPDMLPKVQPYVTLAERLGSFLAQVYEGALTELTIEYRGEVTQLELAPITTAALKGLLTPILEEPVNFVNAPLIAKERGIRVKEIRSTEVEEFISLVRLRATSGARTVSVAGTLGSRKEPRIVEVDGLPLEVIPEGDLLMLYNDDKPGVVGNVGVLLGNRGINIAGLQLGREKPGGRAISIISIDTPLSEAVLAEIRKLSHVVSVKQIRL